MRLVVEQGGPSLHPTQIIVRVATLQGPRELVVDQRALMQNTIEVGHPVAQHGGNFFLVELPAETDNGAWRVWVNKKDLVTGEALEAAE